MLLNFAVISRLMRKGAVAALLILALVPTVQGQARLLTDRADVLDAEQRLVFDWQVDAADSALKAGLAVSFPLSSEQGRDKQFVKYLSEKSGVEPVASGQRR